MSRFVINFINRMHIFGLQSVCVELSRSEEAKSENLSKLWRLEFFFKMWLISALIISLSLRCAYPLSSGAATSACENMTPSHGNNLPQLTESPVTLSVSSNVLSSNERLTFTIRGNGVFLFRGFMAQARAVTENLRILGTFIITSETARIMACPLYPSSMVTHSDPSQKSEIQVDWMPPLDYVGVIRIQYD